MRYSLLFVYYTSTYSIVHAQRISTTRLLLVLVYQHHREGDLPIANKLAIPTTYYTTNLF